MTTTTNLFETATRTKLRFITPKGQLSTEQVWDLPLVSDRPEEVTLDSVARDLNRQLKASKEESFVEVRQNAAAEVLTLKLDLVKHVIAVRLAEKEAREKAAARAKERQRLVDALAQKDEEELNELSREEMRKRIEELS